MTPRRVALLRQAVEDLRSARDFYDERRQGLGRRCIKSVVGDIRRLEQTSGIHPIHFGLHRALASRFPFAIYYSIADTVTVVGVLDLRRDPSWVRDEIGGRL